MSPPTSTRSSLGEALAGWPPPVLDPAGPFAQRITDLSWALFAMAVVVTGVVVVAVWAAIWGPPGLKRKLGGEKLIWAGGVAFPVVALTALLVWGLTLTARLTEAPTGEELRIRVAGEQWWWRVAYLDRQGREVIEDANEVHIPVGRPVVFEVTSNDVIHSFWVPRLMGKVDMIPGRINTLRLIADRPGSYGGQCGEYCGGAHALMGFVVVAHEPAELRRVLAARAAAARPPATELTRLGYQVFNRSGCGSCHAIEGTPANGLAGPNLTHVGARRSLGAGILPMNQGTLGGWISNVHDIKPGARMPPYGALSGEELRAVAAYLDSLK